MAEDKGVKSSNTFRLRNISFACQKQLKCRMSRLSGYILVLLLSGNVFLSCAQAEEKPARITVLYDAFGKTAHLIQYGHDLASEEAAAASRMPTSSAVA